MLTPERIEERRKVLFATPQRARWTLALIAIAFVAIVVTSVTGPSWLAKTVSIGSVVALFGIISFLWRRDKSASPSTDR
jgi:hypothetical protein